MQSIHEPALGRGKSPSALRTISEAADQLDVPQHVLRFWETKFTQIKPLKRNGGRRFYRPEDMEVLGQIKHLLYKQGYTIKGAKKAFEKRTIDELTRDFSPVGLGQAAPQDNDNRPAKSALATPETIVPSNPKSVAKELREISAELRKKSLTKRARSSK